tara:strand:+ start:459 stop:632 length:174 start_codon:yes stop_codon:yes gene_type:complete
MLRVVEKEEQKTPNPIVRDININEEESDLSGKKQVESATVQKVVVLPDDIKNLKFDA